MRNIVITILSGFSLILGVNACGDSAGGTGTVSVVMTDAPSDLVNVSEVNVTIDEIRIHTSGTQARPDGGSADGGAAAEGADGPGWIVLCTDVRTYNLLDLTNGRFTPLCFQPGDGGVDGGPVARSIRVPAGRISQLRMNVTAAQLRFNDGTAPVSLTIPSGSASGLKINVQRELPAGGHVELKLDFDAAQSINKTGNGEFKMTPVIKTLP